MWMHISNLFSKFKVLIQLVKKIMLQKKEAEFENFVSKLFFFSACCIFFSSNNALATYSCTILKISANDPDEN